MSAHWSHACYNLMGCSKIHWSLLSVPRAIFWVLRSTCWRDRARRHFATVARQWWLNGDHCWWLRWYHYGCLLTPATQTIRWLCRISAPDRISKRKPVACQRKACIPLALCHTLVDWLKSKLYTENTKNVLSPVSVVLMKTHGFLWVFALCLKHNEMTFCYCLCSACSW